MSKRYWLSEIVVTTDPITGETEASAAAALAGLNCSIVYPQQNPQTGEYEGAFALVVVEAANQSALLSDSRNFPLPEFPVDAKVNSMGDIARDRMMSGLATRGMPVTWTEGDRTFKDVIQSAGRNLQPNFDADKFFVSN